MPKISKLLITSLIGFVIILLLLIYFVFSYFQRVNFQKSEQQQLSNELQFAQDSKEGAQNQPFLTKLPIITKEYSIYYSSLNKEIDIVFSKNGQTLENQKRSYESQILVILQNIGVDLQKEKVVWLLEK